MKTQRGVSLAEMLVALAIISILLAIAVPGYANYLKRTRRAEARVALIQSMQEQERYFSRYNRYAAFSRNGADLHAGRLRWWSGTTAPSSAYELSGRACSGRPLTECVELRAVPGTAGVDTRFTDAECGELALRSTGERFAQGPLAECWK